MKAVRNRLPFVLVCLALAAGCTTSAPPPKQGTMPDLWPGSVAGYLTKEEVARQRRARPEAPRSGLRRPRGGRGGEPRRPRPARFAALRAGDGGREPHVPPRRGVVLVRADAPVSEAETPQLYLLLRRVLSDAGYSTSAAKNLYKRQRPFLVNKEPTCTPADEPDLGKQGSYPSGHSAAGWAWALVLAEIAPDRAEAIFERGRAFGQSRVVCNVHWQADVNEGRIMAAATVARLHGDPAFARRSRGREEGARRGPREGARARARLQGRGGRARDSPARGRSVK